MSILQKMLLFVFRICGGCKHSKYLCHWKTRSRAEILSVSAGCCFSAGLIVVLPSTGCFRLLLSRTYRHEIEGSSVVCVADGRSDAFRRCILLFFSRDCYRFALTIPLGVPLAPSKLDFDKLPAVLLPKHGGFQLPGKYPEILQSLPCFLFSASLTLDTIPKSSSIHPTAKTVVFPTKFAVGGFHTCPSPFRKRRDF